VHRAFAPVLAPLLNILEVEAIVETGSGTGLLTRRLLSSSDAAVHAIDPDPLLPEQLVRDAHGRLTIHAGRSEDVIPFAGPVQLAVLDGDPNWYVVHRDLTALAAGARAGAHTPPVVVVHHAHWPFGRRDGYYNPDVIPAEHRKAFAAGGLSPGMSEPDVHGLRLAPFVAIKEFEPRSGVLTAVEQFTEEDEEAWSVVELPGFHGVAVMAARSTVAAQPQLQELLGEFRGRGTVMRLVRRVETARVKAELALRLAGTVPAPEPHAPAAQAAASPVIPDPQADVAEAEAEIEVEVEVEADEEQPPSEDLRADLLRLEAEHGRLLGEAGSLQRERAQLQGEMSELRGELSRVRDAADTGARQLEQLDNQRTLLSATVGELQRERDELAARHEQALTRFARELSTEQGRTEEIRAKSAEAHAQRDALAWRLERIDQDLTERRSELSAAQQRIETEHLALVDATVRLEHTTGALSVERERAQSLQAQIVQLEEQGRALASIESELRERTRLLEGQLAHREDARDAERRAREGAEQELAVIREHVGFLEARERDLAADIDHVARSGSWRFVRGSRRAFRLLTFRRRRPESSVEQARRRLERRPELPALPVAEQPEATPSRLPVS
jgi:hypothetical protein